MEAFRWHGATERRIHLRGIHVLLEQAWTQERSPRQVASSVSGPRRPPQLRCSKVRLSSFGSLSPGQVTGPRVLFQGTVRVLLTVTPWTPCL
eukprot:1587862-Pyramimonas_sp.AAC.1